MRALILCGGVGARLKSLVSNRPKPLLLANGQSLLSWIALHLQRHGFKKLLVNAHYLHDQIRMEVASLQADELVLRVVYETQLLGTAGTTWANRDWLGAEGPFLVHYGDVVHDGDVSALMRSHTEFSLPATIAIHRNQSSNSLVRIDESFRVVEFVERPTDAERAELLQRNPDVWAFSGLCAVSNPVWTNWPSDAQDLAGEVFPTLARRGLLGAKPLGGSRVAVDSPARLEALEVLLQTGRLVPGSIRTEAVFERSHTAHTAKR